VGFGTLATRFETSVSEEIKISSIRPPKYAIRQHDEKHLELVGSILRQGLLQPIIVRLKDDQFELVAGSRRLAACRLLGWQKIPCQIAEMTDQEAFEVALSENIARSTLDPLD